MNAELVDPKVVKLPGEAAVVYAGFGRAVTNDELIDKFRDRWSELDPKQIAWNEGTIRESGMAIRYRNDPPVLFRDNPEIFREQVIETSVQLTKAASEINNWKDLRLLICVTSCPPDQNGDWTKEVARRCSASEVVERNLTCNGAISGLVDLFHSDNIGENDNVVVTAVEPLSLFTDPNDHISQAIFGNGGASLAFRKADFDFYGGKTVIAEDMDGVIRVPKMYDLAPLEERLVLPSWYEVREGGDKISSYTKSAVRLALPEPEGDPFKIRMNGGETAKYFSRQAVPEIVEGLRSYGEMYGEFALNNPVDFIVSHQPSRMVLKLISRRMTQAIEKSNRSPGSQIPNFGENDVPWVLNRAGISNISSATTFVAMAMLADRIKERKPFMVVSYGVGSSISHLILRARG